MESKFLCILIDLIGVNTIYDEEGITKVHNQLEDGIKSIHLLIPSYENYPHPQMASSSGKNGVPLVGLKLNGSCSEYNSDLAKE